MLTTQIIQRLKVKELREDRIENNLILLNSTQSVNICLIILCRIIVSTNGSLLKPQIARKILKIGIDSLSFSIDTADLAKLGRIREGSTLGCFYTKTNGWTATSTSPDAANAYTA